MEKKFRFAFFLTDCEDTPIEHLSLSTRARNALLQNKVKTIGDVVENWDRLGHLKNLGITSLKEIKAAMFAYNLERIWDNDDRLNRFTESLEVV